MEYRYGLKIDEADGEVCLRVDSKQGADAAKLLEMLLAWRQAAAMLASGEISREEYDRWRYFYPDFNTTGRWAKAPSQALSDTIVETLKSSSND